jgi:biotin operon repressor
MPKSNVTSEQFVVLYMQRGGDLDSLASRLEVSKSAVRQRVVKMRNAGIKLPLQRKRKGYNVVALNKLIKEYKANT